MSSDIGTNLSISTLLGGPSSSFGQLFASKAAAQAVTPKIPDIPTPIIPAPVVMPVNDDRVALAARRKSLEDQALRRGRASTILTSDSERLGA